MRTLRKSQSLSGVQSLALWLFTDLGKDLARPRIVVELGGRLYLLLPNGQVEGSQGLYRGQVQPFVSHGVWAGTDKHSQRHIRYTVQPPQPAGLPKHAGLLWEALGNPEEELGRTCGKWSPPREMKNTLAGVKGTGYRDIIHSFNVSVICAER